MSAQVDPLGSGAVEIATRKVISLGSGGLAQAHPLTKPKALRKQPPAGLGQLWSTIPACALVRTAEYTPTYFYMWYCMAPGTSYHTSENHDRPRSRKCMIWGMCIHRSCLLCILHIIRRNRLQITQIVSDQIREPYNPGFTHDNMSTTCRSSLIMRKRGQIIQIP